MTPAEYVQLGAGLLASRFAVVCLALVGGAIALFSPSWAAGLGTWIINNSLWAPDIVPALFGAIVVATWLAVGVYFLALGVAGGTGEQSLSPRLAGAGPATDQNREIPDPGPAPAVTDLVSGEGVDVEGGDATDATASVETSVDHPRAIEASGRFAEATDAPGETPSRSSDTSAEGSRNSCPVSSRPG